MVTAIVLMNVERASVTTVMNELIKVDGITEVYPVAGEYDIVAMIRVNTHKELTQIVAENMPHHRDIIHTKTVITLDGLAKIDIAAAYGLNK